MTPDQVLTHFKVENKSELARILGKPVSTVHDWFQRERIPRGVQFEIQVLTKGDLRADAP